MGWLHTGYGLGLLGIASNSSSRNNVTQELDLFLGKSTFTGLDLALVQSDAVSLGPDEDAAHAPLYRLRL